MPAKRTRTSSAIKRRNVWLIAGAALLVLLGWAVFRDRAPAQPANVLLITVDTLRADALGAYGNATAATPWLDRLAAGGLRFDNVRAHNVVTLPSHANILTGRLPLDHGVRDNSGFRLPPGEGTLATWLEARGFRTAAFVSAFPLDSRFGLSRGFDEYDDRFVDATARPAMLEQERSGSKTVAAADRWLRSQDGSAPWFCWVHVYEPHFPYTPPEPFASRFAGDGYAGEVAAVDAALGALIQPIVDAGTSTRTLVVVTSDHGESLGEHGEATHGIFAYESTLKVPLIVYFPPMLKPRAISTSAGHIDIAPTVLHALRLPIPAGLRGRSLLDDDDGRTAVTYFEALSGSLNRGWAPLTGVAAHGLKYVDLPIAELYDLRDDPGERRNLATARPHQVKELRDLLKSFPAAAIARTDETEDTRRRLRSLGYVAGSETADRSYSENDDPKRLIHLETRVQQIVDQYVGGNTREALDAARSLAREHPRMRMALLQLAHLEREAGNLPAAIAALERALRLNPGDTEAASLLGAYLTASNRPLDAITLLEPYATVADADTQVLVTLALAQGRASRFSEALATLERARAQDPTNAMLLVDTGTIHLMKGDRAEARKAFEAALAMNAEAARAHRSLAVMAMEEERSEQALSHWRSAVSLDPGEYENLLSVAIGLARGNRGAAAVPYMKFFADTAPRSRYADDVDRARGWLESRR
jgi:arylsulfatase A-like enzyme/Flp pilus assembly protein TadD